MGTEGGVSEVDADVDLTATTSSLEAAADSRKRRLMEMKAQVEGTDTKRRGDENGGDNGKSLSFRSYDPISGTLGPKIESKDLFIVEKEIEDQLADTEDTSMVEQVDVGVLAPRKVDWDLKRDVAERMQKLERRTQKAIAMLIKERLSKGQTELATAVNSGAYSGLQDED